MTTPANAWIVPKVAAEPGWATDNGRVNVMGAIDQDDMTPAEAREFAALYLAAADEAEKRSDP